MKVAIVSYNVNSDHMNYGAALHSFAFQSFLKSKGIDSIIVDYYPKILEGRNIKYKFLDNIRFWHLNSFLKYQLNWLLLGGYNNISKYNKFKKFFKRHTLTTNHEYHYKELKSSKSIEGSPYEAFIAESDVIWKLYSHNDFDDVFFLNFPSAANSKKIAYAPSLSSRPFDKEEENHFKELVKGFSAISVRESQGAEYLSKILHKDIPWVLDPTLLLNAEDYAAIAKQPKEKDYILLYNCMVNDKVMVRQAEALGKKLNKRVIEISNWNVNKILFSHKVRTDAGIEEFLGYFMNASIVICNAFHGFCFSVIFKKPMFLFQRDESDFRMKNITDALHLSDRLVPWNNKHIPNVKSIDWKDVYSTLGQFRIKSSSFLMEALQQIKE